MPKAHRIGDRRYCGASTVDTGLNDSVFVNGRPWAVEGTPSSHDGGILRSVYGKRNIYIGSNRLRPIVIGDRATKEPWPYKHPFPPTDPSTGSDDVIAYNAELAGDIKV